jgi:hypothetical protein
MSKVNIQNRLSKLESRELSTPKSQGNDLPLECFSAEEQALIRKAEQVSERLRNSATPGDRFGALQATKEDREVLVAAAEAVDRYLLTKKVVGGEIAK